VLANLVHPVKGFKQPQVLDDVVYEVNPAGKVVWKWIASEHLNEFGFSPSELKLVRNAEIADYLHVNNLKVVGPNRWFAAGDKHNLTGEFSPVGGASRPIYKYQNNQG